MDNKHKLNTTTLSRIKQIHSAVPQCGALSPKLFNIYISDDIPHPLKDVQITTYNDDQTSTASYTKHHKCRFYMTTIFHNKE